MTTVKIVGMPGPQGPQGPQGPAGPGGGGGTGDFTFTDNVATVNDSQIMYLNVSDTEGTEARAQLVLDPNNYAAKIAVNGNTRGETFSTWAWESATWNIEGENSSTITFINAPSIVSYLQGPFNNYSNTKVLVNGNFLGTYNGYSSSESSITIYIINLIPTEDPSVSNVEFQYIPSSKIEIDYDEGDIFIDGQDLDVVVRSDDDVFIQALGDDIHIEAGDDIRFSSNRENDYTYFWRMDSEGLFQLPGDGYISNPIDSSGDPSTPYADTIHIVPDSSLGSDQYLIIDPTAPNHIHIRAGGDMDDSNAQLILGGERNSVTVNDSGREVVVKTATQQNFNSYQNINYASSSTFITNMPVVIEPGYQVNVNGTDYTVDSVVPNSPFEGQVEVLVPGATFEYGVQYTFIGDNGSNNYWIFDDNGNLLATQDAIIGVNVAPGNLRISAYSGTTFTYNADNPAHGVFIQDKTNPSNRVATLGDIPTGATGSFVSQDGKTITVTNGIITNITP